MMMSVLYFKPTCTRRVGFS